MLRNVTQPFNTFSYKLKHGDTSIANVSRLQNWKERRRGATRKNSTGCWM